MAAPAQPGEQGGGVAGTPSRGRPSGVAGAAPRRADAAGGGERTSLLLAAYLLAFANASFWQALWRALGPATPADLLVLVAVALALLAVFWMIFTLVAWPRIARPAWSLLIAGAFAAAYFMDGYGVVVDRVAIQSVLETDLREASEWLSPRMLPYGLAALLPILWLRRRAVPRRPWRRALAGQLLVAALAAGVTAASLFAQFPRLSSLARNHRELQHMINPTTVLQSAYGLARRRLAPRPTEVVAALTDARRGPSWSQPATARRRLLVLVVGESARAASFGLLGYARQTNPRLAREDIIAFDHVRSCGTSTAVSLPCMFSDLGRARYSDRAVRGRESLIDVIGHAGLASLWLDNNTGSKNVAARSEQVSLAAATDPRYCSARGCFDDILVDGLARRLDGPQPPTLVVLHQKGSHGPAYFERYPAGFRAFRPTCESNELDDCTREQILNTYDNSILYTDHTLAETVATLRARQDRFDSVMLYVSDHGESTGEHGMYLHGAPEFIAPDEQTRVPLLLWLSPGYVERYGLSPECVRARRRSELSHDVLFHSVLGLLDVRTRGYQAGSDVFAGCWPGATAREGSVASAH